MYEITLIPMFIRLQLTVYTMMNIRMHPMLECSCDLTMESTDNASIRFVAELECAIQSPCVHTHIRKYGYSGRCTTRRSLNSLPDHVCICIAFALYHKRNH